MHQVKCKFCGKEFDRDVTPTIQVSAKRYAHKECAEAAENNKTQEQKDQEELEKYIMKLFDEPYVNARVKKQIKDYKEQYQYSYSGMLKTLIYWFEVKGNSIEKANGGIGIIPFIYPQALNYYYSLYLAQLSNESKNFEEYHQKTKIIEILPPEIQPKMIKLFNLDDSEE